MNSNIGGNRINNINIKLFGFINMNGVNKSENVDIISEHEIILKVLTE